MVKPHKHHHRKGNKSKDGGTPAHQHEENHNDVEKGKATAKSPGVLSDHRTVIVSYVPE